MNEVKIFEHAQFGRLRTLDMDGRPYFVAKDVAEALGYAKTRNAIQAHCRYALKQGVPHPQGKGVIKMNIIPEGDVYRLVAHSKLPAAERFEGWVFDEVLPKIMRTGRYNIAQGRVRVFIHPDFGKVCAVLKEDGIWFRAQTICEFLAVEYAEQAVAGLPVEERCSYLCGGKVIMLVNERGVESLMPYAVRKRNREELRKWLADEVMPALREEMKMNEQRTQPVKQIEPPMKTDTTSDTVARLRAQTTAFGEILRLYEAQTKAETKQGLRYALEATAADILKHTKRLGAGREDERTI